MPTPPTQLLHRAFLSASGRLWCVTSVRQAEGGWVNIALGLVILGRMKRADLPARKRLYLAWQDGSRASHSDMGWAVDNEPDLLAQIEAALRNSA